MSTPSKITKLRESIAATKARIQQLQDGAIPIPQDHALALADEYVNALATAGDRFFSAGVDSFLYPDGELHPLLVHGIPANAAREITQLIALLDTDKLRGAMHSKIRQRYADLPTPMTAEQRRGEIAGLKNQLRESEIAEHKAVEEARAAGASIEHREDIDPAVLLGFT